MLERIRCHAKTRCVHNGQPGMAPLLQAFFKRLAAGRPAVIFPSDWPQSRRVIPDTSALPADTFYVGFTSGSTGEPKAFYRNHQSWLASFAALGKAPQTIVTTGDLSHSLHLFAGVYACHYGCHFTSMDHFSLSLLQPALGNCDWVFTTPAQLRALCQRHATYTNVKKIWVSGAALLADDVTLAKAHFPSADICQFYGASETSFIAISDRQTPPGSVGKPAAIGVDIKFDDQQRIWVRSPMTFSGYLLPEHLPASEWVTVDDVGYLDEQGYLFVNGRHQRMINTAGLNIYPEEVERELRSLAGIRDAVIVGLPCPLRGEKLAGAFIADSQMDIDWLKTELARRLGKTRVPKTLRQLPALPHNRAGKIDLGAVRELLSNRR
ncbi:AMP-binding protein [Salinibius halmophilus]|uniref:AMP-binding protein n=1 Tax=Salinibius halmophilus TaxID=1853216 RepID=UPI000E668D67|nr:AMP-binding protein [Salinibius halmophilus]